jgi:hypothetical protein
MPSVSDRNLTRHQTDDVSQLFFHTVATSTNSQAGRGRFDPVARSIFSEKLLVQSFHSFRQFKSFSESENPDLFYGWNGLNGLNRLNYHPRVETLGKKK